MGNEVCDLLARGITKSLHTAEIGRIRLDQSGVELMLANQLAEAIADLGATIVPVSVGRLRRELFRLALRLWWFSERTDFLNGTDANAIGLAQGSVNGTGLRDPHLGAMDDERDIRGVGVAIADKTG